MSKPALHAFFNPESIALVGVPSGFKAGSVFLFGLLDQGFPGPIYPVHPHASEIGGLRAYRSLADIPGAVDLVIVLTPKKVVMDVLAQCAEKKVKAVRIYTSGFSETGDETGKEEEQHLKDIARKGDFRILGPNCMGIFSPASKLAFFPEMPRTPGDVALLSQSGSLSNLSTSACAERKVFLRHSVSYGNGIDVDLPELLDYMADDPEVRIICSYCEGVRDGRALIDVLRRIKGTKPVIMWKAGLTEAGKNAAASHTGSLSGKRNIWEAVFRQYGIVDVHDMEEMLDTLMAFYHLPSATRDRVVILSGPGGPAVSASDAVEKNGLVMAQLDDRTKQKLRDTLPATGTSYRNPIDVGLSASFDLSLYLDSLDIITRDNNVDATIVLGGGINRDSHEQFTEGLIKIRESSGKAVIAIAFPGFVTEKDLLDPLCDAGIPVYPTFERAIRAYAKLWRFHRFSVNRHTPQTNPGGSK